MNKVKRLTIKNRIRNAWKGLTGAPADNITIGLTVKRCDECDRGHCAACGHKMHSERIGALHDCNDCGRLDCGYKPQLGADTRINCPLWERGKA